MPKFLVLDPKDNVAVAVEPAKGGEVAELSTGGSLTLNADVPFAHKTALAALKAGDKVVKYGEVIGAAYRDIKPGDHVHVHNIRSLRNEVKK